MKHSKKIAIFFSLIPGAGHMYLGLTRQGIQLMLLFFLTFGISVSINLGFIAIFLPIIWFYSVFDVRSKASSEEPLTDSDLKIFSSIGNKDEFITKTAAYKYIGYGFIFVGIAALINNIVFPIIGEYIDYRVIRFVRSSFTSLIFLFVGFTLLRNKNKTSLVKGDANLCKEEE